MDDLLKDFMEDDFEIPEEVVVEETGGFNESEGNEYFNSTGEEKEGDFSSFHTQ